MIIALVSLSVTVLGLAATLIVFGFQWRQHHDSTLRALAAPVVRSALRLRAMMELRDVNDRDVHDGTRELLLEYEVLAHCYRMAFGDNVYARLLRVSHIATKTAAEKHAGDPRALAQELERITLALWS